MGLLLSRSHSHGENNSPQSAFYTDRSRTSSDGDLSTTETATEVCSTTTLFRTQDPENHTYTLFSDTYPFIPNRGRTLFFQSEKDDSVFS